MGDVARPMHTTEVGTLQDCCESGVTPAARERASPPSFGGDGTYEMMSTNTWIRAHRNGTHLGASAQCPRILEGVAVYVRCEGRSMPTHVDMTNPPAEYTAAKANPTTVAETREITPATTPVVSGINATSHNGGRLGPIRPTRPIRLARPTRPILSLRLVSAWPGPVPFGGDLEGVVASVEREEGGCSGGVRIPDGVVLDRLGSLGRNTERDRNRLNEAKMDVRKKVPPRRMRVQ